MEDRTTGADNRAGRRRRSATYQLKLELRRLERADCGESPYATALRRVLRSFSDRELDAVIELLEEELKDLERDGNGGDSYADALRKAVALIEPAAISDRQLFKYYLGKMERDGRGHEPFAEALRHALSSPGRPSLDQLFVWRDANEGRK